MTELVLGGGGSYEISIHPVENLLVVTSLDRKVTTGEPIPKGVNLVETLLTVKVDDVASLEVLISQLTKLRDSILTRGYFYLAA